MTRAEELQTIMESVINGHYTEDDLELFKAEYGWADWMCDYTEAADDEAISESTAKVIDKILEEGFKMAFDPICIEIYLKINKKL